MESSDDAITSCASTGASVCLSMLHLGNTEVTHKHRRDARGIHRFHVTTLRT